MKNLATIFTEIIAKIYQLFKILIYLILTFLLPYMITFFTEGDHIKGECHCHDNPTVREYLLTALIVALILFYKYRCLILKIIRKYCSRFL
jgi:hypothetical protein